MIKEYFLRRSQEASGSAKRCPQGWPELGPEALYGLPGKIVQTLLPHTESDLVALLIQLLAVIGNVIGPGAHFLVGKTRHCLNLFVALVGSSSKARKGTALAVVLYLVGELEREWLVGNLKTGLVSGEGLIHQLRDSRTTRIKGRDEFDPGVDDKRLLVKEPEFASVLKAITRDGNTLSAVLRNGWDGEDLQVMAKNSGEKASSPHLSVVSHITEYELHKTFRETEQCNGFGNRFLWAAVRRSKLLPSGGHLGTQELTPIFIALTEVMLFADGVSEMTRDSDAEALWHAVYPVLSEERFGLVGALTARAEAQTIRLSCLYALMDLSAVVREEHLLAALALWRYCDESAQYLFGNATGDPVADDIEINLKNAGGEGLSRTRISGLFKRNRDKSEIDRALERLTSLGRVHMKQVSNGQGRPAEMWFATESRSSYPVDHTSFV